MIMIMCTVLYRYIICWEWYGTVCVSSFNSAVLNNEWTISPTVCIPSWSELDKYSYDVCCTCFVWLFFPITPLFRVRYIASIILSSLLFQFLQSYSQYRFLPWPDILSTTTCIYMNECIALHCIANQDLEWIYRIYICIRIYVTINQTTLSWWWLYRIPFLSPPSWIGIWVNHTVGNHNSHLISPRLSVPS